MKTLGKALPKEMKRVRDEVLPIYLECGAAGLPAVYMMRTDLDLAAKALSEGDIEAMIKAYQSLKGYNL